MCDWGGGPNSMANYLPPAPQKRDLTWGANCEACDERINAGRAEIAAEKAGDGPLLCGSCRDQADVERLRRIERAARVYFREFDHLVGDDYPERRDLAEALRG